MGLVGNIDTNAHVFAKSESSTRTMPYIRLIRTPPRASSSTRSRIAPLRPFFIAPPSPFRRAISTSPLLPPRQGNPYPSLPTEGYIPSHLAAIPPLISLILVPARDAKPQTHHPAQVDFGCWVGRRGGRERAGLKREPGEMWLGRGARRGSVVGNGIGYWGSGWDGMGGAGMGQGGVNS